MPTSTISQTLFLSLPNSSMRVGESACRKVLLPCQNNFTRTGELSGRKEDGTVVQLPWFGVKMQPTVADALPLPIVHAGRIFIVLNTALRFLRVGRGMGCGWMC